MNKKQNSLISITRNQLTQMGVVCVKNPTGGYLPSLPLYTQKKLLEEHGLAKEWRKSLRGVSDFFVEKFGEEIADRKMLMDAIFGNNAAI